MKQLLETRALLHDRAARLAKKTSSGIVLYKCPKMSFLRNHCPLCLAANPAVSMHQYDIRCSLHQRLV